MNDRILWDIIDGLRDELNIASDGIVDLNDVVKDLQAENKTSRKYILHLEEENKRLKDGFGHGVLVELEQVDALKEQVSDLMIDKDRLVEQVSSNRGNSSSTHTISKEVRDYMHHNPNCKGVRLFILPHDEFNDGVYDTRLGCSIDWDDGIEV